MTVSTYSSKAILDMQVLGQTQGFEYSGTGGDADKLLAALVVGDYATNQTSLTSNSLAAEVAGGSYARQYVTYADASTTLGKSSISTNIVFPAATAAWGFVTHIVLVDGNSNVVFFTQVKDFVSTGDQLKFTQLDVSEV